MEQTDLRTHRTAARLTFADHMNRFIAGDRAPSSPEGAEMLTGVDPPLDGAVVLLEHVIQIRHWPMPAILGQIASALNFRLFEARCIKNEGLCDTLWLLRSFRWLCQPL
jgi:hypothetical protein